MFAWLAFVVIAIIMFVLAKAQGRTRFLAGFSKIIDRPEIRQGFVNYLDGRSYLVGEFKGRKMRVLLQVSASEASERGHLIVSMETSAPLALEHSDFEQHARDRDGELAIFALKARHDLRLALRDSCVHARWERFPPFLFPGRFNPDKWRDVLDAMHALATSLERGAGAAAVRGPT
jgi:hypothetical protein